MPVSLLVGRLAIFPSVTEPATIKLPSIPPIIFDPDIPDIFTSVTAESAILLVVTALFASSVSPTDPAAIESALTELVASLSFVTESLPNSSVVTAPVAISSVPTAPVAISSDVTALGAIESVVTALVAISAEVIESSSIWPVPIAFGAIERRSIASVAIKSLVIDSIAMLLVATTLLASLDGAGRVSRYLILF